ncbi:glutamine synthetase/guanido kinase [Ramaria rubella]|nr:glutamine synthetase/guanido kinase [Ramaria rubella]
MELQHILSEGADGQYEVVTGPLPPLEAVDALVATREIIFNIAAKHGLHATLSPKPLPHQMGTALHTNISLTSTKKRDFTLGNNTPMNELQGSFLQSLLDHLPAACAFTLSSPQSYSRSGDGVWSGGTWVCWGAFNRECPVRVCGSTAQDWRMEVRVCDATGNPYLTTAALLLAGILGVEKRVELTSGNIQTQAALLTDEQRAKLGIVHRLPQSVEQAIDTLKEDKEVCFGMGAELVTKYISTIELRRDRVQKMSDQEQREWMARNY